MEKKLISAKTFAAIGIGSVLMFVLNHFAAIPTWVPGTNFMPGMAILAAFSAIFGPVAGFFIGFAGHFLVDLTGNFGRVWWSWILSSALFGLGVGSCWKMYHTEDGVFGIKQALIFNCVQIAANILAYIFISRALSLIFYQELLSKLTLMGFVATGFNIAVVLIAGTLLIAIYTKIIQKTGSQKKE